MQARFFCKYLKGELELPSADAMRLDTRTEMDRRWSCGYSKRKAHMMNSEQEAYYNSLANDAQIEGIPPVYVKIWGLTDDFLYNKLFDFRNYQYKILDDHNYIQVE